MCTAALPSTIESGVHWTEQERTFEGTSPRRPRRALSRAWLAFLAAVVVLGIFGAAPALADNGKVLVFTGTAGSPNPASAPAAAEIQALGTANDFSVDVTSDATQINTANLKNYRTVVFVNSSGDVLNAAEQADLQAYVQGGGGWFGIGESAMLEQGNTFFDQLIGLTGNPRVSGTGTSSAQDVEFLDRVNPSTRDLPMLWKGHTETWYQWTNNPTGLVQTVARVRFGTSGDGSGTSVTNDATNARWNPSINGIQPQTDRAAAWCRDVQQGRSFYSEIGGTSAAWGDANVQKLALGAIEWTAGLVRGNCKATINSNYTYTRITPQNPAIARGSNPTEDQQSPYTGELTNMVIAPDGRIFYTGRSICWQNQAQIADWTNPNVGLGCGTIHVYDPRGATDTKQNPALIHKVASLSVFGAKGGGNGFEAGQNSPDEEGLLAIALDPQFDNGRPYIYVQYFPFYGGEQGKQAGPSLGPGFDRTTFQGERRISRFTYSDTTHSLVAGSEKVIMSWTQPVFSCCHEGSDMAWDSAGNLYVTNGDNIGNNPNATNGGYTNADPRFTPPCPGDPIPAIGRTMAAGPGCAKLPQSMQSYADARGTAGNTNNYSGKIIRIHPMANPGATPGIGSTYTIPGADAPNGPQLFPEGSSAVTSGLAKPEIFAMGVRNDYTIHIDPKTDLITTAWVGPDQTQQTSTWGPAKTENATMMNAAGNYGWPFCQAGNRWDYRVKEPSYDQTTEANGGVPANLGDPGTAGAVGGGADGQTGAFFDCRGEVVNNSPFNTGLQLLPAPKPVNIWYGPQGGCYGYPKNANGVGIYPDTGNYTASPGITRSCPFIIGGSQAPMDGGIYRVPPGSYADHPTAWPAYWDGRWFLMDFATATDLRHALLMDPATQTSGGQPLAADNLLSIIPTTILNGAQIVKEKFGPDGALYVESYSGGYYSTNDAKMAIYRFDYVGGADTPGADPQATPSATTSTVAFGIGDSGGVSYSWDFGDGSTSTQASPTHTFASGGAQSVKLTVTYADGATDSKTISVAVPPTVSVPVSVKVPATLALAIGGSPTFDGFVPATTRTYTASTTATVTSTGGDAALTVVDPDTTNPGHMVNDTYVLAQPLQTKATDAAHATSAFASVTASPTTLLTWAGPVSYDMVTLGFQQAVAQTDPLRTGVYEKTLLFTLSSTTP